MQIPQEYVEAYENHQMTSTEIAEQLGKPHSTVSNSLRKMGIKPSRLRKVSKANRQRNDEIVEAYKSGQFKIVELTKIFNVKYPGTIRHLLKKAGILKKKLLVIPDQYIEAYKRNGMTVKQIANCLGMTNLDRVYRNLKKVVPNKISFDIPNEYIEAYKRNEITAKQIANILDKGVKAVIQRLKRLGLKSWYHQRKKDRNKEIFKLYHSGKFTRSELATKFNISLDRIKQLIEKYK